jgi:hypothetical protein
LLVSVAVTAMAFCQMPPLISHRDCGHLIVGERRETKILTNSSLMSYSQLGLERDII